MFEIWMHKDGEIHLLTPGEPREFAEGWEKLIEVEDREIAEKITDMLIHIRNKKYNVDKKDS